VFTGSCRGPDPQSEAMIDRCAHNCPEYIDLDCLLLAPLFCTSSKGFLVCYTVQCCSEQVVSNLGELLVLCVRAAVHSGR
jgi:hypothetical protein